MPIHTLKELLRDFDSRLNVFVKLLLISSVFICLIVLLNDGSRLFNQYVLGIYYSDSPLEYTHITVSPDVDLEVVLKRHNLWDIEEYDEITPVVLTRFPLPNLDKEISDRKKGFFHALLPAALIAQAEVELERQLITESIAQIGEEAAAIDFDLDTDFWQKNLSGAAVSRLVSISGKYEETNAASLLTKVDVIPVSLILAQSAIESAWGVSRFAVNGNNLFGIWTWGENGMIPQKRDSDKNHRVSVFVSILDSVRAYTLIINKVAAYELFREIRTETRDPLKLADGLINYSSRRNLYVTDVKNMINQNNLKSYDTNSIAFN
nr:glucosaminidase domain-containing protein [Desulfobulbaceae bacterium]